MQVKLKNFINENIDLINENTKESWEKIYNLLHINSSLWGLSGGFTQTILDSGINDPAEIMGYIPKFYLRESSISNYKIPDNVTSIRGSAFAYCDSLTSITIPDSVTHIDWRAFEGCQSLEMVIIPDSVTSIGHSVFHSCSSLKKVVIPDSVTSIDDSTFYNCSSLTSVVIPNSVTSIDADAFSFCESLKEINFKGTKEEAIKLGIGNRAKKKWRAASSIKKIICNDGEIIL